MYDLEISSRLDGRIGADVDEYLFYLVTQVANRRNRDFTPILEKLGLSLPAWRAMSVINRLGDCLMNELSDFTTVDRTTLTRTVDQLVSTGFVVRSVSSQDRRQVLVNLTPAGKVQFDRAMEALKTSNADMLNGLTEQDLCQLRASLQRILSNIVQDRMQFQRLLTFERQGD